MIDPRLQVPGTPAPGAATPGGQGAEDGAQPPDVRTAKLDRVATTLISAVAAVGGLLAVFGVSSEQVSLLLDDDAASEKLVAAGFAAAGAVGLSLGALMSRSAATEVTLLSLGAVAYVSALVLSVFAAAGAADFRGFPAITEVDVESGPPEVLVLMVQANSLDERQRIKLVVSDLQADGAALYSATMRPDNTGHVEQRIRIPVPADARDLELQAWRLDASPHPPGCETTLERPAVVCTTLSIR